METNIEIKQALEELNKIAVERVDSLEKEVRPDIDKLKNDLGSMQKQIDLVDIKQQRGSVQTKHEHFSNLKSDVEKSLNENKGRLENYLKGKKNDPLEIEIKEMSLSGNLSGGTAAITMQPTQIVGAISRAFHVRDVLPQIGMTTSSLPIILDNSFTGGFETVAEGAVKPDIDFFLKEQPAQAEVIAAVTTVTKKFLDDLGPRGVMSWLQNRLTELYLNAEDDQLLNGDGVSPNLIGLNDPGNFTAATATGNPVEVLIRSMVQMRVNQRNPKVIIIHPADLGDLILNKASGSDEYDFPPGISVNASGGLTVLGINVIDTVGQTEGVFNILDTTGIIMGVREALNIRFFEDAALAKYNKIMVRAEARVCVANYSPYNVIKGFFGNES